MLIIASPAENWFMATGEFCYLKVDDTQVYELQFVCLGVKKQKKSVGFVKCRILFLRDARGHEGGGN